MTLVDIIKDKAPEVTFHTREDLIERELSEVIALHLYSIGSITSGTASKLIGISRVEFLQLAGRHKIPMFEFSTEELQDELREH